MDWTIFWTIFWTVFLDHFYRGGSTPLVLREGRDAVYQYTEGGLGGTVLLLREG